MAVETIFQGSLFSTDFLSESITRNANWQRIFDAEIERIATDLRGIFAWQCQEFRVWAAVEPVEHRGP